jgi:hypothetical protein
MDSVSDAKTKEKALVKRLKNSNLKEFLRNSID